MKHSSAPDLDYRFYAYVLVSSALAVPVLLWPMILYRGVSDVAYAVILDSWLTSIALLLMVSATADSVLAGVGRLRDMLSAMVWIVGMSLLVAYALRMETGAYLLAAAFAVHSLRSAGWLWKGAARWWMWPAWIRDVGVAATLFGWLLFGIV